VDPDPDLFWLSVGSGSKWAENYTHKKQKVKICRVRYLLLSSVRCSILRAGWFSSNLDVLHGVCDPFVSKKYLNFFVVKSLNPDPYWPKMVGS
jgi:hypothetical protein